MKERIKRVRNSENMSQTDFAKCLSVSRSAICKIESGENFPSEQTINLICREFDINEDWLRTGEGEMQIKRTRNQEIQALANSVMLDVDESFKKRFFVALSKLKESDWEVLEKLIDEISNKGGE